MSVKLIIFCRYFSKIFWLLVFHEFFNSNANHNNLLTGRRLKDAFSSVAIASMLYNNKNGLRIFSQVLKICVNWKILFKFDNLWSFSNEIKVFINSFISTEPFDLTNTARSAYDGEIFEKIKSVFFQSWCLLREYKTLDSLFQEQLFVQQTLQQQMLNDIKYIVYAPNPTLNSSPLITTNQMNSEIASWGMRMKIMLRFLVGKKFVYRERGIDLWICVNHRIKV